jgi:hypothetical protein
VFHVINFQELKIIKYKFSVHKGRTLVAKKWLTIDFTYGGLKVFFSKEIAEGLVLNTLQRLNMQQDAPEG